MAKKKKKKVLKQRVKQRRAAKIQKRKKQRTGRPISARQPNLANLASFDDILAEETEGNSLIDDMLPLFSRLGDPHASPMDGVDNLSMAIVDSGHFLEEPEFEDIFIEPMLAAMTFVQSAEELGFTPEVMDKLPEQEQVDRQLDIIAKTGAKLIDDELYQKILEAVENLRRRLKKEKKQQQLAQITAVQMALSNDEPDSWPEIGLIHQLVGNSVAGGFELMSLSELIDSENIDADNLPSDLFERLSESKLAEKIDKVFTKIPGLGRFLSQESDKIHEAGMTALRRGELALEIFSLEELETINAIFAESLEIDEDTPQEERSKRLKMHGPRLIQNLGDHLEQLFTPDRLAQLRDHLTSLRDRSGYPSDYDQFVITQTELLKADDAVEVHMEFFVSAIFGETDRLFEGEDEADTTEEPAP